MSGGLRSVSRSLGNKIESMDGLVLTVSHIASYHCTYAKMWIRVKYVWGLSVKAAEKRVLMSMLDTC